MDEKTIRHTIRFPEDIYEKLREISAKDDRSINWEVITAVRLLVEKHEKERGTLSS